MDTYIDIFIFNAKEFRPLQYNMGVLGTCYDEMLTLILCTKAWLLSYCDILGWSLNVFKIDNFIETVFILSQKMYVSRNTYNKIIVKNGIL
jgi:hypothetical protein